MSVRGRAALVTLVTSGALVLGALVLGALAPGAAHAQESAALGRPAGAPASASPLDPELMPEARPRYAGVAERPLTLPEGLARIDQLVYYRVGAIPVPVRGVPMGLALGVHDDFELGVQWGVLDDPSLYVLGRFVHTEAIDVGASARITVPAMTPGDTVLRAGVPVAIRAARWLRIDTGADLELLFASQVSPLVEVPLTVTIAPHELFFMGAMGSVGWLDGDDWVADVGGFVGWSARNLHGVIADGRVAVQVFLPGAEVVISLALRFFPRFF